VSITNTWQVSFSELPYHNLNMQKQTPTWHSECSYGSYGSKILHQGFTSSYPMTPMTLKEVVGEIARCDRCDKHIGRFCSTSYGTSCGASDEQSSCLGVGQVQNCQSQRNSPPRHRQHNANKNAFVSKHVGHHVFPELVNIFRK